MIRGLGTQQALEYGERAPRRKAHSRLCGVNNIHHPITVIHYNGCATQSTKKLCVLLNMVTGTTSSIWRRHRRGDPGSGMLCSMHRVRFFAMADIEENANLRQPANPALASRDRARDRCAVRDQALHQLQQRRRAPGSAADAEPACGRGPSGLYARTGRQAHNLAKASNTRHFVVAV